MVSELAQESFRWEREQYKAALATANERIRGLIDEIHFQACLTKELLPYQERAVKAEQALTAERAVSDRLLEALKSLTGHGGMMGYVDHEAIIAEVESMRAQQSAMGKEKPE